MVRRRSRLFGPVRPGGVLLLAACLLPWACAKRPPALPGPGTLHVFPIPWENAFPSDVAVDSTGRLWFTDRLTHAVGVFDPVTETFVRHPTPTVLAAPYGLAAGPDGGLWFGESRGGRLGRVDPATGAIEEVRVPGLNQGPYLLAWAGEHLWFTARDDGAYGRYDPATGRVDLWRDAPPARPYAIAATPDGGVWVASYDGGDVARVDERQDSTTLVSVGRRDTLAVTAERLAAYPPAMRDRVREAGARVHVSNPGLRRMAAAPDGRLWLSGFRAGRVSVLDPATGAAAPLPTLGRDADPYGITVDPWGRVWFYTAGDNRIVVLDPATGGRVSLALPVAGGTVRNLVVDAARGRVWLPMSDVGVIGLVELAGG